MLKTRFVFNLLILTVLLICGLNGQSSTMIRGDIPSFFSTGFGGAIEHQFQNRFSLIISYQKRGALDRCFGPYIDGVNQNQDYLCANNSFIDNVGIESHFYSGIKYYAVNKPKGKLALGLAYSIQEIKEFSDAYQQAHFDYYGVYSEDQKESGVRLLIDYHYMFFSHFGLGAELAYSPKDALAYSSTSASINFIYKF